MKALFLDVDGVLNTRSAILASGTADFVCPKACELVNGILRETGAVLVLSSDWRFLDDTDSILDRAGLAPRHPVPLSRAIDDRCEAAMVWMQAHPAERWCAIDDHPMWRGHAPNFVKVYGAIGLKPRHARQAVEILS